MMILKKFKYRFFAVTTAAIATLSVSAIYSAPSTAQSNVVVGPTDSQGQQRVIIGSGDNVRVIRTPQKQTDPNNPFFQFDTNGDNIITRAEAQQGKQQEFNQFDTNNNGRIESSEISRYMRSSDLSDRNARNAMGTLRETLANSMGLMDANGDGVVSFDEFGGQNLTTFNLYDVNQDGTVMPDEVAFISNQTQAYLSDERRQPVMRQASPEARQAYAQTMDLIASGQASPDIIRNLFQSPSFRASSGLSLRPDGGAMPERAPQGSLGLSTRQNGGNSSPILNQPPTGPMTTQPRKVPGIATPETDRRNNNDEPKPIFIP